MSSIFWEPGDKTFPILTVAGFNLCCKGQGSSRATCYNIAVLNHFRMDHCCRIPASMRINQPMTGCCFNQQMMGSLFQSTNEGELFQLIKWKGVVSINKWWGVVSMMFGGLNWGEEENACTKSQECWWTPSMLLRRTICSSVALNCCTCKYWKQLISNRDSLTTSMEKLLY